MTLQVDVALALITTILPTLQTKTGIVGAWISSTSYDHVRSFLRTQGIFDGDIRHAIAKLKSTPTISGLQKIDNAHAETNHSLKRKIYIFSDWSFSSWSDNKRTQMLAYMINLLHQGASLYTFENEQLVEMTIASLQNVINGDDFDNLLSAKLQPATRAAILSQA